MAELSCQASLSGIIPGLGFLHLVRSDAQTGIGGVRGAPKGFKVASRVECCQECRKLTACIVWLHRGSMCYLGNCSAGASLPCLERMRTSAQPASQPAAGVLHRPTNDKSSKALLCARPTLSKANTTAAASDASEGLALLLLGHRQRLMLTTLPANVVAPTVKSGISLTFFAFLENSLMSKAFRGRRPVGNPQLADLNDADLMARISRDVQSAGGSIGEIRIAPRPNASLPKDMPMRLSRYSVAVKRTVATRFLKETLGLQMVIAYEASRAVKGGVARFSWVLWTREDAHWFAPFKLHLFQRGAVHGKACGGFGGWNDKVWLMDRDWAEPMLSMYDDFHRSHPSSCNDLLAANAEKMKASSVDFLAAPSVEQFRERVGKLRRIPFTKHPAEALPTMDSYYTKTSEGSWKLCFPKIYAAGCVPKVNASAVETLHTCERQK